MRTCKDCAAIKPLTAFYQRHRFRRGRWDANVTVDTKCKACRKPGLNARRNSPRGKYSHQKNAAARRGIPFLLTFDQWRTIWEPFWEKRGRRYEQYVMARHGDVGPYAVGNVSIVTQAENVFTGFEHRKGKCPSLRLPDRMKQGRVPAEILTPPAP